MIIKDHHSQLQNAAYQYQCSTFEHPEFDEVMQQVFGDNCTGVDVMKWTCYWIMLTTYCEKLEDNDLTVEKPMACSHT